MKFRAPLWFWLMLGVYAVIIVIAIVYGRHLGNVYIESLKAQQDQCQRQIVATQQEARGHEIEVTGEAQLRAAFGLVPSQVSYDTAIILVQDRLKQLARELETAQEDLTKHRALFPKDTETEKELVLVRDAKQAAFDSAKSIALDWGFQSVVPKD